MTSKVCIKCGAAKPAEFFGKDVRTPDGRAKTCSECRRVSAAAGGKARQSKRTTKPVAEPEPVKLNGHLEVPSGLGFRASLEDGLLCIEQDRPCDDGETYTHSLALARHEARKLIDWIEAQVQEVAA